ncbi:MAG: hypothetical protein H8D56_09125 [Planctomycetes bacterium]|nr:hypothetical protein [Planctomycetota bacterium]MBL7144594.1 hypothetical protein [Phycisphaerae bacterium]
MKYFIFVFNSERFLTKNGCKKHTKYKVIRQKGKEDLARLKLDKLKSIRELGIRD